MAGMDEIDQHLARIKAKRDSLHARELFHAEWPELAAELDWLIECVEIERNISDKLSRKLDGAGH